MVTIPLLRHHYNTGRSVPFLSGIGDHRQAYFEAVFTLGLFKALHSLFVVALTVLLHLLA